MVNKARKTIPFPLKSTDFGWIPFSSYFISHFAQNQFNNCVIMLFLNIPLHWAILQEC